MSGEVGELAKWTIEERDRGGLRKVLWKPHGMALSSDGGAPPAADDASGAEPALTGAALCGDDVSRAA